jgi:hypothetical protein
MSNRIAFLAGEDQTGIVGENEVCGSRGRRQGEEMGQGLKTDEGTNTLR